MKVLFVYSRFRGILLVLTVLTLLPVLSYAQKVQFPKPEPMDQSDVSTPPRLSPPPHRIPPPRAPGAPEPGPASRPAAPEVVSTLPPAGASDVDPALREIRVTFDKDMDTRAYAFSGARFYPRVEGTAYWLDSRTCALPVALAPRRFYRVGVNLEQFNKFKGMDESIARPFILCFTTVGADPVDVAALKPPQIVALTPPNGASGVTPGGTFLKVVFSQPMRPDFELVAVEHRRFPKYIGIGTWAVQNRQLTFPCRLEAQKDYVIGLNSPKNLSFQNDHGVPLEPVKWEFNTIHGLNEPAS